MILKIIIILLCYIAIVNLLYVFITYMYKKTYIAIIKILFDDVIKIYNVEYVINFVIPIANILTFGYNAYLIGYSLFLVRKLETKSPEVRERFLKIMLKDISD